MCLLLVVCAAILRSIGLDFGLPHAVARPDEETLVGNALLLERVDGWNPKFFSYPSLMIYSAYGAFKLLLVGKQLSGGTEAATMNALFMEDPGAFHWVLRGISVVCGALTVVATFLSARSLFGRRTALLSAMLLTFCYLHVRDSHFGVTDVPCVLLVSLAFWKLTDVYRRGKTADLLWASVFAGLAIGTKYTAAWLCWPMLVAIVASARRYGGSDVLFRLLRMAVLAAAVTVVVFAMTTPFFFLDFDEAVSDLSWEAFLLGSEPPLAEGINGYLDHFRVSLWYGLGWPVLLTALAGGLWMAWRRNGKALLLWSLPLLYYLYAGRSDRIFIRYMDIVLPFLVIACAWTVRSVYVAVRRRRQRRCPRGALSRSWPFVAALILLAPSLSRIWAFDRCIGRVDSRSELRAWMLEHVPLQEAVLWSGGWSAMPYMIHHAPVRLLDATEKVLPQQPDALYRYRWVVLVDWPRAYYQYGKNDEERAFLAEQMHGRYELFHEIDGYKADLPPELFSLLDHFYMSYAEPGIIHRPGPGFRIYRRIG